jgi:molybdate transport system permease protein
MAAAALRISLLSSCLTTVIGLLVGVPLAWLLARIEFAGKQIVRAMVTIPLVLPPVVGGAALLFVLGRRGVLGEPLYAATGLLLPFSLAGVVAAQVFVSVPFLIVTVEAGLRNLDPRFEQAAAGLGAKTLEILFRIALPMAAPAVVAGSVLTWARALAEFGATITFAGNLAGRTQTIPLAIFVALEGDRDAALALSVLMMVVSLAVIAGLRRRWWPSR